MFLRANFNGDPNIGLYGFATEKYVLLGSRTKISKKIEEALGAKILHATALHTGFTGIFCAGNSSGIVMPRILREYELEAFRSFFENILVLDTDYSALGNLLLLNDSGVIVSPLLRRHKAEIQRFFGLPCAVSKVCGVNVVGSMAVAVNSGCLAGVGVKKKEIEAIEDVLDVELGVGTVGYGSRFVRSGIIANSRGCIVSDASTGPEMGRISEALGLS